jgi:hypothetical protein
MADTTEKVYINAGPEFGENEGKILLVDKALYGLKTSGGRWHQRLAGHLLELGFSPTMADYDLWIREFDKYYEYIAVVVDDLMIFAKDPKAILKNLETKFSLQFKGVGEPRYYNGADIMKKNSDWTISAETYVNNVVDKIEKLFCETLNKIRCPMDPGEHPELDESDLLDNDGIKIYQMLMGSAQWAISLGRFDIQYATNTLARYAMNPRQGHLKMAKRIFAYLKHVPGAYIRLDIDKLNTGSIKFETNEWGDIYNGAKEDIADNVVMPKHKGSITLTMFVDANHANDLVTRRSVTGFLIFAGHIPICSYSKRQNTVESATYGSELMAARIALEHLLGIRYKLRAMGIRFDDTTAMLCDNQAVVTNMQLPSSNLKKKHNAVSYHKCREAVAAGIISVGHIASTENIADILTKPLGPAMYEALLQGVLYHGPNDYI